MTINHFSRATIQAVRQGSDCLLMCLGGCYSPSEVGIAYASSEVGLLCSEGRATKIKLLDAVWAFPCSVLCWVLLALFLVINSQLIPAKAKHPFCRLALETLVPVVRRHSTCTQSAHTLSATAQSHDRALISAVQCSALAKLCTQAYGFNITLQLIVKPKIVQ